jgi:hypothetical protein
METFLSRRANDPRFANERRVPGAGGSWYSQPSRPTVVEVHTFSASNYETSPKVGDEKPKKKKRKSGEAFTESEKKKLENRTSSDDSDGGPCWVRGMPCLEQPNAH